MTNRVDTFNRADGIPLGTPSDGGSAWVSYSGTWGIKDNKANEDAGTSQAVAALEAGITDADVQVTVSGLTGGQDIGVVARLSDNNNYIIGVVGNSDFRIYKKVGGSYTQVGSTYATAPVNGDVILLSVSGTSVSLKVNGTTRISGTVAELTTNTKYGIRSNAFTINSFDEFSITALGAGDTTLPTLTGSITDGAITTTSYTASWPAGTDNVAVTGYEYRINAGSWVDVGNVLTINITGRTPSSTDTFEVRAYDAAGNKSTPALSTSVALAAVALGTITFPAVKDWSTGNLKLNESGVTVIVNNVTTGALVIKLTGKTTHATTGVCTVSDALIIAGTQYRATLILADGSEGTWKYSAT